MAGGVPVSEQVLLELARANATVLNLPLPLAPSLPPQVEGPLQGEIVVEVPLIKWYDKGRGTGGVSATVTVSWWGQREESTALYPLVCSSGGRPLQTIKWDHSDVDNREQSDLKSTIWFPVRTTPERLGKYFGDCDKLVFRVYCEERNIGTSTIQLAKSESLGANQILVQGSFPINKVGSTASNIGSMDVGIHVRLGRDKSTLVEMTRCAIDLRDDPPLRLGPGHELVKSVLTGVLDSRSSTKSDGSDMEGQGESEATFSSSTTSFEMNEVLVSSDTGDLLPTVASASSISSSTSPFKLDADRILGADAAAAKAATAAPFDENSRRQALRVIKSLRQTKQTPRQNGPNRRKHSRQAMTPGPFSARHGAEKSSSKAFSSNSSSISSISSTSSKEMLRSVLERATRLQGDLEQVLSSNANIQHGGASGYSTSVRTPDTSPSTASHGPMRESDFFETKGKRGDNTKSHEPTTLRYAATTRPLSGASNKNTIASNMAPNPRGTSFTLDGGLELEFETLGLGPEEPPAISQALRAEIQAESNQTSISTALQPVIAAAALGLRDAESVTARIEEIDYRPALRNYCDGGVLILESSFKLATDPLMLLTSSGAECGKEAPSVDRKPTNVMRGTIQLRQTSSPAQVSSRYASASSDRAKPPPNIWRQARTSLESTWAVNFDRKTLAEWVDGDLVIRVFGKLRSEAETKAQEQNAEPQRQSQALIGSGTLSLRQLLVSRDLKITAIVPIYPPEAISFPSSLTSTKTGPIAKVTLELFLNGASGPADRSALMKAAALRQVVQDAGDKRRENVAVAFEQAFEHFPLTSAWTRHQQQQQQQGTSLARNLDQEQQHLSLSLIDSNPANTHIDIRHRLDRLGNYVRLTDGEQTKMFSFADGQSLPCPFILEAYDAEGSLIGIAKLPDTYDLPFQEWVQVTEPFSGSALFSICVRLQKESQSEVHEINVQQPLKADSEPDASKVAASFALEGTGKPVESTTQSSLGGHLVVDDMSPTKVSADYPSGDLSEARKATASVLEDAKSPTKVSADSSSSDLLETRKATASILEDVNEERERRSHPSKRSFHHVFVFEITNSCAVPGVPGTLVHYAFPNYTQSDISRAVHAHQLWWDCSSAETNTIGRHLIETKNPQDVFAHLPDEMSSYINFEVIGPSNSKPTNHVEGMGQDQSIAPLGIAKLQIKSLHELVHKMEPVVGISDASYSSKSSLAPKQVGRTASIFRIPLHEPLCGKPTGQELELNIRYLLYEEQKDSPAEWFDDETSSDEEGTVPAQSLSEQRVSPASPQPPPDSLSSSRGSSNLPPMSPFSRAAADNLDDREGEIERTKLPVNGLSAAQATICFQIAGANELQSLARTAAHAEPDLPFLFLAAAVGINVSVSLHVDLSPINISFQLETPVKPRTFKPILAQEGRLPVMLDAANLAAVCDANAWVRVWHTQPSAGAEEGDALVLLGEGQVPFSDLLLQNNGVQGQFPVFYPKVAREEQDPAFVELSIFFEHHRQIAQLFPLPQSNDIDSQVDEELLGQRISNLQESPQVSPTDQVEGRLDKSETIAEEASIDFSEQVQAAKEQDEDAHTIENESDRMLNMPLHEVTKLDSISSSDRQAQQSIVREETKLVVYIQEAMHLPLINIGASLLHPNAYVNFDIERGRILSEHSTEISPDGPCCSPKWPSTCASFDISMAIGEPQSSPCTVLFHVWHRTSWTEHKDKSDRTDRASSGGSDTNEVSHGETGDGMGHPPGLNWDPYSSLPPAEANGKFSVKPTYSDSDVYIGTAVVDLSALRHGIEVIHGWYHIIDKSQRRVGQLKVLIRPSVLDASLHQETNAFQKGMVETEGVPDGIEDDQSSQGSASSFRFKGSKSDVPAGSKSDFGSSERQRPNQDATNMQADGCTANAKTGMLSSSTSATGLGETSNSSSKAVPEICHLHDQDDLACSTSSNVSLDHVPHGIQAAMDNLRWVEDNLKRRLALLDSDQIASAQTSLDTERSLEELGPVNSKSSASVQQVAQKSNGVSSEISKPTTSLSAPVPAGHQNGREDSESLLTSGDGEEPYNSKIESTTGQSAKVEPGEVWEDARSDSDQEDSGQGPDEGPEVGPGSADDFTPFTEDDGQVGVYVTMMIEHALDRAKASATSVCDGTFQFSENRSEREVTATQGISAAADCANASEYEDNKSFSDAASDASDNMSQDIPIGPFAADVEIPHIVASGAHHSSDSENAGDNQNKVTAVQLKSSETDPKSATTTPSTTEILQERASSFIGSSTFYNQLAQDPRRRLNALPDLHICSSKAPIIADSNVKSPEKRKSKSSWMDPETARIARILKG